MVDKTLAILYGREHQFQIENDLLNLMSVLNFLRCKNLKAILVEKIKDIGIQ